MIHNTFHTKNWQILSQAPKEFIAKFPEYDSLILQLLYSRGIKTQKQVDEFFNPDYEGDLFDPFLLSDMQKACDRIEQAVLKKERVGIFGDYDADGVTSSVLLTDFLKNALGLSGQVYIPDRTTEGYGVNKKALDWLLDKKIKLVITCDCGVSNKPEIDYGRSRGLDFIVLDHHHLHQEFSDDYIIVNPKQNGDKYPFKELAACGVVFKFIQAVIRAKPAILKKEINPEIFEKWLLDLVAIGTVADCVSLISENRTLVKYGMRVLAKTKRLGLQKIFKRAGIDPENLETYNISFMISPRINSAGRMDHANAAYKLLATKSEGEAGKLSLDLEGSNKKRQKICDEIILEAKEQIKKLLPEKKILYASGESWPLGVVGVAAGKICEEFSRPTFILSKSETKSAGSARSIPQFNIIEAITKFEDLLLEYGGHKQAAGIAMKNENVESFFKKLEKEAKTKIKDSDLTPTIKIDARLDYKNINFDFYGKLQEFEPYGSGNEKPIFMLKNSVIMDITSVGSNGRHLKMKITDKISYENQDYSNILEVIGFNHAPRAIKEIKKFDAIDLVFELDSNTWAGQSRLQLKLVDFRKHESTLI